MANREALSYDKLGNIKTLQRSGTASSLVDDLSYTYAGNRLAKVVDANANASGVYQLPSATTYAYDANGNLKSRANTAHPQKNITSIAYNHLNLPRSVATPQGTVTYTYDASGRKLRSVNGITGQTRDYIDGIEYAGGTLELIHMEEGRIVKSGGSYEYEYVLRDHLGNSRVGFKQSGAPTTTPNFTADYYPFGLQYQADIRQPSPKNNYLYNNKELQEGLAFLDYGARFYDPVIARWHVVDALTDSVPGSTPYNYGWNNPIRNIDPDGNFAVPPDDYFDIWGNYLGSDNSFTHNIRVMSPFAPMNLVQNGDGSINRQQGQQWSSRLNLAPVSGKARRNLFEKVGTHYYSKLGFDVSNLKSARIRVGDDDRGLMYVPKEGGDIFFFYSSGMIDTKLENYHNLMSTLIHENEHIKQGPGIASSIRELGAYKTQLSDRTWNSTMNNYKSLIYINIWRNLNQHGPTAPSYSEFYDFFKNKGVPLH